MENGRQRVVLLEGHRYHLFQSGAEHQVENSDNESSYEERSVSTLSGLVQTTDAENDRTRLENIIRYHLLYREWPKARSDTRWCFEEKPTQPHLDIGWFHRRLYLKLGPSARRSATLRSAPGGQWSYLCSLRSR